MKLLPRRNLEDRQQYSPILKITLKDIWLICCPNLDRFHDSQTVSYVFYGKGYSIDDPEYQEILEIVGDFPHNELRAIWRTCRECRRKGVC